MNTGIEKNKLTAAHLCVFACDSPRNAQITIGIDRKVPTTQRPIRTGPSNLKFEEKSYIEGIAGDARSTISQITPGEVPRAYFVAMFMYLP